MHNTLPFLLEIPASEYHESARRGKFLSSHLLGDFRKAPILYHKKMTGEIESGDSAAFLTGRAVHTLVLEGRAKFDAEFMISDGPVNPKTGETYGKLTKAYKEWAAAQNLPIVSGDDFAFMTKLQRSVWLHPVAAELLDQGEAERTVRCCYCGEMCQIRMDWFREDYNGRPIICVLKTCDNLDYFESDARRYGYGNQMAFYKRVLETASDGECSPDVYFIAVEKREPFRTGVWKLTDAYLESCTVQNERAIEELRQCRMTNSWPTRTEDIQVLDL